MLESKVLIESGQEYDFAEENVKECNDQNRGCYGGTPFKAASYFTGHGAVSEICDPYNHDTTGVCNTTCPKIKQVTGWRLVVSNDVSDIKSAVYQYGPCYTNINASFPGFGDYDGSYVLHYTGNEGTDHAVMIVGWDDNMQHAGGTGAWIGKNSWGAEWGDNGFFYIAYGSAKIGSMANYYSDYKDYDSTESLYYYDEGGWSDSHGYPSSKTAWGLARFAPSKDGFIHAVDMWVVTDRLDYTIYIYDDFDGDNVSSLLHSQSGTVTTGAGYYSIPLTSQVWVPQGDDFAVVVEYKTQGYAYPVSTDSFDTYHPIETGRCYMSPDGSPGSWTDLGVTYDRDIGIRTRVKGGDATSEDILATWDSSGVWYWNSLKDHWVNMAEPADLLAAGDVDGDGNDDLLGGWSSGLWVKQSSDGSWVKLVSSPPDHVGSGDMNGDGRVDIVATWSNSGVWYWDSLGGIWTKISVASDLVAAGNIDGDNIDDLIGVWKNGLWVRYSSSGTWFRLTTALPDDITSGDMNGDGRDDVVATWSGSGVWYRDSIGGGWVKITSGADNVAEGDVDGDGTDDLVGVWSNGLWVKNSSTMSWEQLTLYRPRDIDAGLFRTGPWNAGKRGFLAPLGRYEKGPGIGNFIDLSGEGPGGWNFVYQIEKNLLPQENVKMKADRIPGPGEPGFTYTEHENLVPHEGLKKQ
jgi:hypothetical protein